MAEEWRLKAHSKPRSTTWHRVTARPGGHHAHLISLMAFEAILSQQRAAPSGWRRIIMTFSVLLHAIALAAGVAHSVWQVEEMPMPAVEVTLAMAPPPPPPPPPPPKRPSSKPKTKPIEIKPKAIVAPKETPKDRA